PRSVQGAGHGACLILSLWQWYSSSKEYQRQGEVTSVSVRHLRPKLAVDIRAGSASKTGERHTKSSEDDTASLRAVLSKRGVGFELKCTMSQRPAREATGCNAFVFIIDP
ncbi:unnamed protein product, partial [Laminaria digitata]